MKKWTGIIIGVASAILVALIIFLGWSGAFYGIQVTEGTVGPYKMIYEDHMGDYKEAGNIQMMIYEKLLKDEEIETTKGFGVYYDDPKKVSKENLRSKLGCVLEKKDYKKLKYLRRKYKVLDFPATQSLKTDFPFKNVASIIFGVMKVYPAFNKYAKSKEYTVSEALEVYDVPNKKIYYSMKFEAPVVEEGQESK